MTTVTKAVDTYNAAIEQLIDAVNALDQAHSMLKDIDLHNYINTKLWGRYVNIQDAVHVADGLLKDLQDARCPECGGPLADISVCLEGQCQEGPQRD